MSVLTPIATPTSFGRAREIASDLAIVTALVWTPPLLLGLAVALFKSF